MDRREELRIETITHAYAEWMKCMSHERSSVFLAAQNYGMQAIRGLVLSNAGAIVVVVAVVGHLSGNSDCGVSDISQAISLSTVLFTCGLLLALFSSYFANRSLVAYADGYKNITEILNHITTLKDNNFPALTLSNDAIQGTKSAVISGIISALALGAGSLMAIYSLAQVAC